ncbi:TPA: patatin-like phospholipase family protein [Vibrio vulnificus]|nr:patatin-like phospholipase family protein [Vibrio vulnificus]HDY7873633.1 patatin-like phospholipase family protein [Vibrio vulnificus]
MKKDQPEFKRYKKGLALSGGGFRATLYALGSLIRMNEDGLLTELDTITAVSGGAIAAGYLMLKWQELKFEPLDEIGLRKKAVNFHEIVTEPLMKFCHQSITNRGKIFLHTLTPWKTPVEEVRKKYEDLLFGKVKLKDVPDLNQPPQFVFYGTNLDTGASVRISKEYFRDYQLGRAANHDITLAQAVSISSGFPPFLSPIILEGSQWLWEDELYQTLEPEVISSLRDRIVLCDGGLYDNMGLEMLWKHGKNKEYEVVFSCDAGAPFSIPWSGPFKICYNWIGQFLRMSDVMIDQQRSLRKRMLVRNFIEGEYKGSYWSIENKVNSASANENKQYEHLKQLGTQLEGFGCNTNRLLVNVGFLHADDSLTRWYDRKLPKRGNPFLGIGINSEEEQGAFESPISS